MPKIILRQEADPIATVIEVQRQGPKGLGEAPEVRCSAVVEVGEAERGQTGKVGHELAGIAAYACPLVGRRRYIDKHPHLLHPGSKYSPAAT